MFVDGREILNDKIMETIEHDEEHTNAWGESKEPFLREAIGLQSAVFECPHCILFRLVAPI